jgi:glutamine---fructose-6-phosphate transaminase (isomerizing)
VSEPIIDDLERDICEQPDALASFLDAEAEHAERIAADLERSDVRYVLIAGRGSSDNAARYAQYLFGAEQRLPVAQATPSLFTRYGAPPRLDGALVIAVSQSGASHDVVEVVREARRQGRPTVSITNTPGSPIGEAAEHVLHLHAGAERAHTASKSYVSSLAAFALLIAAMHHDNTLRDDLFALPDVVRATLERARPAAIEAAAMLVGVPRATVVGRGFNYSTAHEIALKLTAVTRTAALAYSAADVIGGPSAKDGTAAVLVAPSGRVLSDVLDLVPVLRERSTSLITISDLVELRDESDAVLPVPQVREWLSPLVTVVPGQLLALEVAQAQGTGAGH